jgi:hypothetical protein
MKFAKIFILISLMFAGCQQTPAKTARATKPPEIVRVIAIVVCNKPMQVLAIDNTGGIMLLTPSEFEFLASDPDFQALDPEHRGKITLKPPGGCAQIT